MTGATMERNEVRSESSAVTADAIAAFAREVAEDPRVETSFRVFTDAEAEALNELQAPVCGDDRHAC